MFTELTDNFPGFIPFFGNLGERLLGVLQFCFQILMGVHKKSQSYLILFRLLLCLGHSFGEFIHLCAYVFIWESMKFVYTDRPVLRSYHIPESFFPWFSVGATSVRQTSNVDNRHRLFQGIFQLDQD